MPRLARDLGHVVDTFAAEGPLVLAGHSIGGMTIMALPEVRPDVVERVAGLVLVATSSGGLDTVTLGVPEMGPLLRRQLPRVLATRARLLPAPSAAARPRSSAGWSTRSSWAPRCGCATPAWSSTSW